MAAFWEEEKEKSEGGKDNQPTVMGVEEVPADLFVSIVRSSSWFLSTGRLLPASLGVCRNGSGSRSIGHPPECDLQPTALNEIEQGCFAWLSAALSTYRRTLSAPHILLYRYLVN